MIENYRVVKKTTSVDRMLDEQPIVLKGPVAANRLDAPHAQAVKRKLLDWYFQERERQAVNRYQMAIDADFYDGDQWSLEDAQEVESRGQAPLVYNETAPMIDWMIGTERRSRVDWKVAPRTPNDVDLAGVKTKVMKYVSDVNKAPMVRSRAFADAVKVGVGWIDDGIRTDPSAELLYSRYEDWRYVIWDSTAQDLDLQDGRYLFRWRWVDLDVACQMYPERKEALHASTTNHTLTGEEDDEFWYLGQHFQARDSFGAVVGRRTYMTDAGVVGNRRRRVKLIEGWFREPTRCQVCFGDAFDGQVYEEHNSHMRRAVQSGAAGLVDQVLMRMHVAVMTERDLMALMPSPYRHQRFPLTPVWCYRRGRDRMPYGAIRRVRDPQEDLNKRASKALFVLSTNQIIGDKGAVDDWDEAREEADRPDGVMVTNANKRFELRRDAEMAKGQMEFMQLDSIKIQRTGGVTDENRGLETNATSEVAIKARQLQGSVVTTEPYDNLRYATQISGEKQLSLIEQFYTAPKVIRLTESSNKGTFEWLKINEPEQLADGSVRFLNDITASMADFVVDEQDYHGTLRQAMFEAMMGLVSRAGVDPGLSIKLLRMAFEFSDFPNKDEIVSELRKLAGEPDPNRKPTPEEQAQIEKQQQMQAEAIMNQQQLGRLAVEEAAAKVRLLNGQAEKAMAEALTAGMGDGGAEDQIRQIQTEAASKLDEMAQALREAKIEANSKILQINKQADVQHETARIDADAKIRVAEIQARAADQIDALMKRIEDMQDKFAAQIEDVKKKAEEERKAAAEREKERDRQAKDEQKQAQQKQREEREAARAKQREERERAKAEKTKEREEKKAKEKAEPKPAAPAATIVFEAGAIQVDAKSPAVTKTVTGQDGKGNQISLTIKPKGDKDGST